jgi:hypothetical protein
MNRHVAKLAVFWLFCVVVGGNSHACTPLDIYIDNWWNCVPVGTYTLSVLAKVESGGPVAIRDEGSYQWAWDGDPGLVCSYVYTWPDKSTAYGIGSATPGVYGVYVIACNESDSYDWDYGYVVVVGVGTIKYNDPQTGWTDMPDPLYVFKGTTVSFKALAVPSGAPWPYGKPVWGGSAGATGTGETTSVALNSVSSSTSDYKTVTAECGNTVTVNVLVYDLTGNLVPEDNFSGRSQTDYGLEELVGLSYTTSPSGISGLPVQWTIESGVGTLNRSCPDLSWRCGGHS